MARVSLSRLIKVFAWTGLTSLGGGRSAYFHDQVVVRRPWLTNQEFAQDFTLSQILPGTEQRLYSHQNEDIVRLTPQELKRKMAEKEAVRRA